MFISSSFSGGLDLWSVNYTSISENSEWNVFKNINFLGKYNLFGNWPNHLLGKKALEYY